MRVNEIYEDDPFSSTQVMRRQEGAASTIARQIVQRAEKNIAKEDVPAAVERAISAFADQIRKAAREELKYYSNTTIVKKLDPSQFNK